MTVKQQAVNEARKVTVRELRFVKRDNKVVMCRLSNGVCGFGKTQEAAKHEAYARAARALVRAINTSRIGGLTAEQMKQLDKALR